MAPETPSDSLEGPLLDIEDRRRLLAYLRAERRIARDEDPRVTVLAGGVSNRTVLVERADGGWVVKQALAKLRVPVDWFSDPARVHREAAALRALGGLAPPGSVPGFVFEDERFHLLCMESVPEPHENWKEKLLAGRATPFEFDQFGILLGTIHRKSSRRLGELGQFEDRSFFESLRLEPYYLYTAERVREATPFLHRLVDETHGVALALVHGDYSPKNVLVHKGRLVLLDHEVAHLGDPAFDLGFSLAHLLSKARHLPAHQEALAAGASRYLAAYRTALGDVAWGVELEPRAVRHTLACLLARARGRSQLEYLSANEKDLQAEAVVRMLSHPPKSVAGLTKDFLP